MFWRSCATHFPVEQWQISSEALYHLGRGDRRTDIDLYITTHESAEVQFAAWSHFRNLTKGEHWPHISRSESTISCSVPSTLLAPGERKRDTDTIVEWVSERLD